MKVKRPAKEIKHLLPTIKRLLKKVYGRRLAELILFGSFARDKASADSDIDIALVLRGRINKAREIDKIYDVLYDLILETGELISVFPMSQKEMKNSRWPLYFYIRTEGEKI